MRTWPPGRGPDPPNRVQVGQNRLRPRESLDLFPDRETEDGDQFGHPQGVQVQALDSDSKLNLDVRPMRTRKQQLFCSRIDRKNCGFCETLTLHRGVTAKYSAFVRVQSQALCTCLSRRRYFRSALGRPSGHSVFQGSVCPVALRRGETQPRMSISESA